MTLDSPDKNLGGPSCRWYGELPWHSRWIAPKVSSQASAFQMSGSPLTKYFYPRGGFSIPYIQWQPACIMYPLGWALPGIWRRPVFGAAGQAPSLAPCPCGRAGLCGGPPPKYFPHSPLHVAQQLHGEGGVHFGTHSPSHRPPSPPPLGAWRHAGAAGGGGGGRAVGSGLLGFARTVWGFGEYGVITVSETESVRIGLHDDLQTVACGL